MRAARQAAFEKRHLTPSYYPGLFKNQRWTLLIYSSPQGPFFDPVRSGARYRICLQQYYINERVKEKTDWSFWSKTIRAFEIIHPMKNNKNALVSLQLAIACETFVVTSWASPSQPLSLLRPHRTPTLNLVTIIKFYFLLSSIIVTARVLLVLPICPLAHGLA